MGESPTKPCEKACTKYMVYDVLQQLVAHVSLGLCIAR